MRRRVPTILVRRGACCQADLFAVCALHLSVGHSLRAGGSRARMALLARSWLLVRKDLSEVHWEVIAAVKARRCGRLVLDLRRVVHLVVAVARVVIVPRRALATVLMA